MRSKNLLLILLYLLTSCILAFNIIVVIVFAATRLFFLIFYNVPFEMNPHDLIRYIKAASFTGCIVAIGNWWMYFKHYRKCR